jgi:tetratricopeptide (TPR) repeat protein
MRQQLPGIRYLVLLLALLFATGTVAADSRSEARTHYQAGVKFYASGDYKSAIREFSAAQQLAPADLNNYNLALCYDKLGDPEPAIQYYRAFLEKQPSSDKKAEIEASIARLEAASRSVAAKKAQATRKAEEEAARKAAEEAKKAEEAKAEAARKAEEEAAAKKAEEAAASKKTPDVPLGASTGAGVGGAIGGGAGSTGTPSSGTTVSTGDAQLDRASTIDINQIRDTRMGSASSGIPNTQGGPAAASVGTGAGAAASSNATATAGAAASTGNTGAASAASPNAQPGQGATDTQPKKATPVYKKWWFWAVVVVSAYVVYSIAKEEEQPTRTGREQIFGGTPMGDTQTGGVTLMRW